MIDPRHPLFGQRFPLHGVTRPLHGAGHVFVRYRQTMVLRLPLGATTLAPLRLSTPTTLTLAAVTELVTLAGQCEALCPPDPLMSGPPSPPSSVPRSVTTSPPSSTR